MTEKEIIDKYLGWKYRHKARGGGFVDCWGLIILINRDRGIEILDLDNYERDWHLKEKNYFIDNYYKRWKRCKIPEFLDVLLFNSSKGIPFHAGIYLSNGRFIHGSRQGVVITRINNRRWKERLEGIYRYDNR